MRVLVGFVFAAFLSAQRPPPGTIVDGPLGKRLEAAVAAAAPDYWGTVLVAVAGKPVFVRGYGAADRSPPKRGKKSRGMDSKSVFDLGGTAGQLTALLVLRLQADRKLRLRDPVGKYLKNWPTDKQAITIDHLLLHTSGFPAETNWKRGSANAVRTAIEVLAATPLHATPGQEFRFSPLNNNLLALVIEECVGQRFDKLLEDRVLKPFGMSGAGRRNSRFSSKLVTIRRKADGSQEPATKAQYNWRVRGASGVLASVHDVHALLDRIHAGRLVDARERDLLWRPMNGGALKIIATDVGGRRLRRIEGFAGGYRTRWTMHGGSRSWVVLCTGNKYRLDGLEVALVSELATVWGEEPTPTAQEPEPVPAASGAKSPAPATPAAEVDRFVGTFALPTGGCFWIERKGSGLRLHGEGVQASVRLADGAWPGPRGALVQRSEDRGLALLGRLVRGDATVIDEAFAETVTADATSMLLAGILAKNGELKRIDFLGTDFPARGKVGSWFRFVCARGQETVRVGWRDEKRFASCVLTTAEPPFAVDIVVHAADTAMGKTAAGRLLRLTIEGLGDRRTLVFEDQTVGDDGLVDCRLSPKAPR